MEKYRAQVRDRDAELAKANEEVDKRVRETCHEYETLIADLEFRHKRAVREAVQRAAMQDDTELDALREEVRGGGGAQRARRRRVWRSARGEGREWMWRTRDRSCDECLTLASPPAPVSAGANRHGPRRIPTALRGGADAAPG